MQEHHEVLDLSAKKTFQVRDHVERARNLSHTCRMKILGHCACHFQLELLLLDQGKIPIESWNMEVPSFSEEQKAWNIEHLEPFAGWCMLQLCSSHHS